MNTRTLAIVLVSTLILFILIPQLASRGNNTTTQQITPASQAQLDSDLEATELAEDFEEIIYEETDALEEDWQNVDTDYSLNTLSQVNVPKLNALNTSDISLDQVDYVTERNGQAILVLNDGSERIINQFDRENLAGNILAQLDRSYED